MASRNSRRHKAIRTARTAGYQLRADARTPVTAPHPKGCSCGCLDRLQAKLAAALATAA